MDAGRLMSLSIEHQHSDRTWHELKPVEHGSEPDDPEREWGKHRLFRCVGCPEEVRIKTTDNPRIG